MIRAFLALAAIAASSIAFAPPAAAASSSCTLTASPLIGHYAASKKLHGPGLWLDGGGTLDGSAAPLSWVHDTIAGRSTGRFGNVVVLRATGKNEDASLFYKKGDFASVQELLIPPCASAAQIAKAARYVDRADVVFFAEGDRADYVAWKNSPFTAAVKRVYARGGVVGGAGAGAAIQGAVIYDAVSSAMLGRKTTSTNAIADPFEGSISLTKGLFAWPALHDTITDTEFAKADRFGRAVVFLALIRDKHLLAGSGPAYALGIDRGSSVVVGANGIATVYNGAGGLGAYLVRASGMPTLSRGTPLTYDVDMVHVARNGEHFDLLHKRAGEAWFPVTVSGKTHPPYAEGTYQQ